MPKSATAKSRSGDISGESVVPDNMTTQDGDTQSDGPSRERAEVPNLKTLGYLRGYAHFQLDEPQSSVRNACTLMSVSNHGTERGAKHIGAG